MRVNSLPERAIRIVSPTSSLIRPENSSSTDISVGPSPTDHRTIDFVSSELVVMENSRVNSRLGFGVPRCSARDFPFT